MSREFGFKVIWHDMGLLDGNSPVRVDARKLVQYAAMELLVVLLPENQDRTSLNEVFTGASISHTGCNALKCKR